CSYEHEVTGEGCAPDFPVELRLVGELLDRCAVALGAYKRYATGRDAFVEEGPDVGHRAIQPRIRRPPSSVSDETAEVFRGPPCEASAAVELAHPIRVMIADRSWLKLRFQTASLRWPAVSETATVGPGLEQ